MVRRCFLKQSYQSWGIQPIDCKQSPLDGEVGAQTFNQTARQGVILRRGAYAGRRRIACNQESKEWSLPGSAFPSARRLWQLRRDMANVLAFKPQEWAEDGQPARACA